MSGNRHVGRVRWIARDVLVRDCGRIELAACEPIMPSISQRSQGSTIGRFPWRTIARSSPPLCV